jgi:hypothetical protein
MYVFSNNTLELILWILYAANLESVYPSVQWLGCSLDDRGSFPGRDSGAHPAHLMGKGGKATEALSWPLTPSIDKVNVWSCISTLPQ